MLLEITPAIQPPDTAFRRLKVSVNGNPELDTEVFSAEAFLLDAGLPPDPPGLLWVEFDFDQPVVLAGETRPLAFALTRLRLLEIPRPIDVQNQVTRRLKPDADVNAVAARISEYTGKSVADFLMGFESLGNTCDFGHLQRRFGAEPIGLFRFAGIDPGALVRGLLDRFAALDRPEISEITILPGPDREYLLRDRAYGIRTHAGIGAGMAAPEQVVAREARRLTFLRRHFLELPTMPKKCFSCAGQTCCVSRRCKPLGHPSADGR